MKTLILLVAAVAPAFQEMPSFHFFSEIQERKIVFVDTVNETAWQDMVAIVKDCEGYRAKPYRCPAGVWTIGYGHTATAKARASVSESEAQKLLIEDLKRSRDKVRQLVTVPLTTEQEAALTSFTFNCGENSLRQLVNGPDRLNSGNYQSVEKILPLYRMGGGKVLKGLEIRRAREITLWSGKKKETHSSLVCNIIHERMQ